PAARSPVESRSPTTVDGCTPASTTPARSRSRKLSNTARSRLKNTLIRPKPLDQLSTTCGQAHQASRSKDRQLPCSGGCMLTHRGDLYWYPPRRLPLPRRVAYPPAAGRDSRGRLHS